jgi:tetratricopeptide (TPR) repeat protein
MLDRVAVKGKDSSISIYTARKNLTAVEKEGWDLYHSGLYHYYNREFEEAMKIFGQVLQVLPDDYIAEVFFERSERLIANPPPKGWTGEIHMIDK